MSVVYGPRLVGDYAVELLSLVVLAGTIPSRTVNLPAEHVPHSQWGSELLFEALVIEMGRYVWIVGLESV